MFESVRNNKRLVQIFLALIMLPFAFFGVESYMRNDGGDDVVAKVGKSKITQQQFQQALREQEERLRKAMPGQFNPEMMKAPEVRRAMLENLINQRLLAEYVAEERIGVSDEQLKQMLMGIPQLQVDGKFSVERFEAAAAAQGLTKAGFEARLKQDIAVRQAATPVVNAAMVSRVAGERWLAIALEEREISEIVLRPESYLAKVELPADAAKNFYDNNRSKFEVPEQVRFEFVILSQQEFAQKLQVSDAEIKAWYESHMDRYKQPEERRASHILIQAEKDAKPEVVKAAEEKAAGILAQVKKNPADFARLAKAHSQDPGSAAQGGDLGPVARGAMVKPFEDAVFSLKPNQISDLVRTDFGFHIIVVTKVTTERVKPLADVRNEIVAELKTQGAAKKYAEAATEFTNMVYEQPDSLKPVVEKFGLSVQTSPWLPKGRPVPGLNAKLLDAIFSDDAVKNKRNTEAIELAPNTLVSARVLEHKAAASLPLEQVQAQIETKLKRDEAAKLAAQEAEARIAKYAAGDTAGANWSAVRSVPRAGAQNMSGDALRAVFSVSADKLPAYASAKQADGSAVVYRVSKVKPYVPSDKEDPRAMALRQQYAQLAAETEFAAWLNSLRDRFKVQVYEKALEAKEAK